MPIPPMPPFSFMWFAVSSGWKFGPGFACLTYLDKQRGNGKALIDVKDFDRARLVVGYA